MDDFELYCPACDRTYPLDQGLFSCPKARPGEEHTLRKIFGPKAALTIPAQDLLARWKSGDRNSFSLYQSLLGSRDLLGDDRFSILLDYFRKPMTPYEGKCFEVTPLVEAPGIREILEGNGRIWIKDETENITGSQKGRHLMGTLLYLEVLRLLRQETDRRVLAIYSCGNAALAAAAVARAGSYELHAFVPRDMNPTLQQMLVDRDAAVERIQRDETGDGDPCYLAFREAVEQKGWIPFACSGPDNWSNIEGGETLGGEMVLQLREVGAEPACMVLQIGGGAPPQSAAHGILDDETYDWYDLLRAVLKSGGKAEILREGVIQKAHHMARTRTGIRVSATGSAGLAGLLQLRESGDIPDDEDAVLFFTGVDRP
jgi:threonine synthase